MTTITTTLTTLPPYTGIPAYDSIPLLSLYPPEVGCITSMPEFVVEEPVATLATAALAYMARAPAEGLVFKITSFVAGASGYNPAVFSQPVPVTPDSMVEAPRYSGPVTRVQPANSDDTLFSYACSLPRDFVSPLGELALIAEVLVSPLNPGEVGTEFVFAVAHSPAICKHRQAALTLRVLVLGG